MFSIVMLQDPNLSIYHSDFSYPYTLYYINYLCLKLQLAFISVLIIMSFIVLVLPLKYLQLLAAAFGGFSEKAFRS